MVDFLISYKNNVAKIGRAKYRITTENRDRMLTENNDYLTYTSDPVEKFQVKSVNRSMAMQTNTGSNHYNDK